MGPKTALLCAVLAASLTTAFAADGKPLFVKKCSSCHGVNGEGNQKLAAMLKVQIRHLGSPEVQEKSDAELKAIISKGAGKMKPVPGLSGQEIVDLVGFLRTIKKP